MAEAATTQQPETPAAAAQKPARPVKAAAEGAEMAKAVKPLSFDRWRQKEFENPGHCIYVPYGTSIDEVLSPAFWANFAGKLRPGNIVEVHWDDFSEFAEVYVRSAGRNWASVAKMRHIKLEAVIPPQARQTYDVSFNGVVDKFRVLRISDNAVIKAGFATEAQARAWLEEYTRKLNS